ncbi:sugar transferase [Amnibacterium flavum]|uniref:Polyprenyl glycosylphosphotransferase n=1 Tax=Amnibacterium flavum TaxID=2173173 RepID=A0A2V1HVU8_9MICO|nr:sugar transferase [Amnibacterium flavum]PVZ95902.1 polyprenyl glycosylphosphotransferase [Amnibacterium flavum]
MLNLGLVGELAPLRPLEGFQPAVVSTPRRFGWTQKYRLSTGVVDLLVVAAALVVAHVARFGLENRELTSSTIEYTTLGIGIGVVWAVALSVSRSREARIVGVGNAEYQRVANATLATFGVLAVLALLLKLDVARGYLIVALPLGLAFLLLNRFLWRSWLIRRRREGRCLTGAVVVGPQADVSRVVGELVRNHSAGYKPVGIAFTDSSDSSTAAAIGKLVIPVLPWESVATMARATRTRAVIIAGELPGGRDQIKDLGWQLENANAELILVSRLTDVAGPRIHLRQVEGLPMVHVDLPQFSGTAHTVKRLFDVVGSSLALLLLAPVLIGLALWVKLDSPGPVLFRQKRIGVSGEPFEMLKFRSMVVDAEARLHDIAAANEGAGLLFKMRDDPRVTRAGKIMRRYSLDELPQFWNVLNGSMSLIGPRPPLPREVEQYEARVTRRLLIKPGITGLWQVSGRSNLSWEDSVKLDLYYVENWSVTGDFLILARTLRAVLRRDGAY